MDQKELIAGFRDLAQDPDPEIAAEAVAELKKLGAVDVSGQPGPWRSGFVGDPAQAARAAGDGEIRTHADLMDAGLRTARKIPLIGEFFEAPGQMSPDGSDWRRTQEEQAEYDSAHLTPPKPEFGSKIQSRTPQPFTGSGPLDAVRHLRSELGEEAKALKADPGVVAADQQLRQLKNLVASQVVGGAAGAAAQKGLAAIGGKLLPRMAGTTGDVVNAGVSGATEKALNREGGDATRDAAAESMAMAFPFSLLMRKFAGLGDKASQFARKDPVVKRYLENDEKGLYSTPEYAQLPEGREGIHVAADKGFQRVAKRDAELLDDASKKYHAQVDPELKTEADRQALINSLKKERAANIDPNTRRPYDEGYQAELDDQIAMYEKKFGVTKVPGSPGVTPDQYQFDRLPTEVEGLLKRRRGLKDAASFGSPAPSDKQRATQKLYQTYRKATHDASPVVKKADDEFSKYASIADRRRDILFNTEENVLTGGDLPQGKPVDVEVAADELLTGQRKSVGDLGAGEVADPANPRLRVRKEQLATRTLKRAGDVETEPGLGVAKYLEELGKQDPEFQAALDFIANKKALEATRFGLTSNLPLNANKAFQGAANFLNQNKRAARARILDPAGKALGRGARIAARRGSGLVPLLRDPLDALLYGKEE